MMLYESLQQYIVNIMSCLYIFSMILVVSIAYLVEFNRNIKIKIKEKFKND
jgi:hypothetical protein